jgi:hypothetical protein
MRVNGRNAGFAGLRRSVALALTVVESPPIRVAQAIMLPYASALRIAARNARRPGNRLDTTVTTQQEAA